MAGVECASSQGSGRQIEYFENYPYFWNFLSSGVPILQALQITRDTLSNTFFVKAMSKVHDSVRMEAMAVQMEETVFPSMVTSMVEIGEKLGITGYANTYADNYDEDVDNAVAGYLSNRACDDCFLAVVVGFIVIALFFRL